MNICCSTALGPRAPLISIDTAPPIPVVWIVGVPTESLLPLLTDFLLVIREQQQVQGIIIFNSFLFVEVFRNLFG